MFGLSHGDLGDLGAHNVKFMYKSKISGKFRACKGHYAQVVGPRYEAN